jgi:phosphomannomutase
VSRHLDAVLSLPVIDVAAIRGRRFHVALDCVRGAGAVAILPLLERLGCRVSGINLEPDGRFPRAPEPVPENLGDLGRLVRESGADLGFAVDPDVARLAVVDGTGRAIGEDYTLAFAVRAVLDGRSKPAATPTVVVNLSTSLVVEDAARAVGATLERAPVGEANVARVIRERGAVIGGEGNGGVMYPALHIGRDAPLGVALILHLLATSGVTVSHLVESSPRYTIVKAKGPRSSQLGPLYERLRRRFADAATDDRDGLRLSWADRWLHIRPSGTEPILRLIAEAPTQAEAEALVAAGRELLK